MENPSGKIALSFSRKDKWIKCGFYSLCITLFLLPLPRFLSLWTLGGFLFFGLLSWITDFRLHLDQLRNNKLIIAPPVIYFLIYLLSFLLFDPIWENVEDKLMFILIPVIGLPVFMSDYLKSNLRALLLAMISGILVICVYQFSRATFESLYLVDGHYRFNPEISPGISRFMWDQLSGFEHPSYLAIKALWAIVLLFLTRNMLRFGVFLSAFLIVLFSVMIFFLAAKTELLILSILLVYFLFNHLKSTRSKIIASIFVPLFFLAFFVIIKQNSRVEETLRDIKKSKAEGKTDWKDFNPRTRSWFYSLDLIKEKPLFGVGLNARNILAEEYRKKGYTVEADLRLNSHNQYLETQLTLGIFGTLALFCMLISPLLIRKRTWNAKLIIPFLIIITVSMISESILVRQWGIMFFVLFYCLITLPGMARQKQSMSKI